MTIYIDNINIPYGRMIMCHMMTDGDLEELHKMAKAIGMKREWFQDHGRYPHYDVSKSKKKIALSLGAVEVSSKEMIRICRK